MKKLIVLILLITCGGISLFAQERSITFTSVTDAKFFVYLNGRLQNERSTGMITINNLEDKEYHFRIVIDDPFEVATTKRIRPDANGCEYTVRFNAVRERVYLKKSEFNSRRDNENIWTDDSHVSSTPSPAEPSKSRKHSTIRRNSYEDTATERVVKSIKTKVENQ